MFHSTPIDELEMVVADLEMDDAKDGLRLSKGAYNVLKNAFDGDKSKRMWLEGLRKGLKK